MKFVLFITIHNTWGGREDWEKLTHPTIPPKQWGTLNGLICWQLNQIATMFRRSINTLYSNPKNGMGIGIILTFRVIRDRQIPQWEIRGRRVLQNVNVARVETSLQRLAWGFEWALGDCMVPSYTMRKNTIFKSVVVIKKYDFLRTYRPEKLNVITDPIDAVMLGGTNWTGPPGVDTLVPTLICGTQYILTHLLLVYSKIDILWSFELQRIQWLPVPVVPRWKLLVIGAWCIGGGGTQRRVARMVPGSKAYLKKLLCAWRTVWIGDMLLDVTISSC